MNTEPLCAAWYARVSSEQQVQAATIDSQITALEARAHADGYKVPEVWRFVDAGYSGSTLVRPGLEALRDAAASGAIDRVYVHSPDRLSRKYAYQVLLLEELQHAGVEVMFLNQLIDETPEAHLLLQVQGMIAEYGRAVHPPSTFNTSCLGSSKSAPMCCSDSSCSWFLSFSIISQPDDTSDRELSVLYFPEVSSTGCPSNALWALQPSFQPANGLTMRTPEMTAPLCMSSVSNCTHPL